MSPNNGREDDSLNRPSDAAYLDALVSRNWTSCTTIDFVGANALPEGTQASWTGRLTAPTTGNYLLAVQTDGTGGTLTVDGQSVIGSSSSPRSAPRCTRPPTVWRTPSRT
jgi:hypothetical protein